MTQLPSDKPTLFKGRHFNHLLIIQAVRWYVTYKLSYRDVCGLMAERGVTVIHTTVLRWVQCFVPAFEKKWKNYARPVGSSWRVDETYIKVKGEWRYLYRTVDKQGQTVDFLLRLPLLKPQIVSPVANEQEALVLVSQCDPARCSPKTCGA